MKTKIILIAIALLTGAYFFIRSGHKKAIQKKDVEISKLRLDLLQLYKAKSKTDTIYITEVDTKYITKKIIFRDTIEKLIYEKTPENNYFSNSKGDNYSFDYRIMVKGWLTSVEFENIFIKKEIEKFIVEVPFEVVKTKEVYILKRQLYLSGGFYSDLNFSSWVAGFDYFGKKRLGFGVKYFFQSKGIEANIKFKLF